MTPDQAKAVTQALGMQLQNEWMTTYKVISAIPEAKKDWKPEGNSRTAWELALHLAGADVWFLDGVLNHRFGEPTPPAVSTVQELGEWYKREFPRHLEMVLAKDSAHLAAEMDFFGVMKMPACQFLVFTAVHMAHHRGQLSTYLRPMGGKVPKIYGGSFDEPWNS